MEQKSKIKIETYLIYSVFIIFFGVITYKMYQSHTKSEVVIKDSRQEIKEIKDSTIIFANKFIEDVKKDKDEKDSVISSLKMLKKKDKEKIMKISTDYTKKDSEVNQYKEKVDKIYSDYKQKDSEVNQYRERTNKLEIDYNQKDAEVKEYKEKLYNKEKDTVIIVVPVEKKDTSTKKLNFWKRNAKK